MVSGNKIQWGYMSIRTGLGQGAHRFWDSLLILLEVRLNQFSHLSCPLLLEVDFCALNGFRA